jgi:hypothetical protein
MGPADHRYGREMSMAARRQQERGERRTEPECRWYADCLKAEAELKRPIYEPHQRETA